MSRRTLRRRPVTRCICFRLSSWSESRSTLRGGEDASSGSHCTAADRLGLALRLLSDHVVTIQATKPRAAAAPSSRFGTRGRFVPGSRKKAAVTPSSSHRASIAGHRKGPSRAPVHPVAAMRRNLPARRRQTCRPRGELRSSRKLGWPRVAILSTWNRERKVGRLAETSCCLSL